jgi:amino acid transporter
MLAFNAILSSTVVHQLLSYLIPVVLLIYQRRSTKFLPPNRSLALPNWLGWTVNWVVALIIPVLVVFFALPPFRPVTGTNMSNAPASPPVELPRSQMSLTQDYRLHRRCAGHSSIPRHSQLAVLCPSTLPWSPDGMADMSIVVVGDSKMQRRNLRSACLKTPSRTAGMTNQALGQCHVAWIEYIPNPQE